MTTLNEAEWRTLGDGKCDENRTNTTLIFIRDVTALQRLIYTHTYHRDGLFEKRKKNATHSR